MNTVMIRLEGFAVLAIATTLYFMNGYSGLLFALLLLAPDVFMIGYMRGNATGARVYNLAHTYIAPLLLLAIGWFFSAQVLLMIGLIWTAHIGLDRTMGYGLKYASGFKDTHLQRL